MSKLFNESESDEDDVSFETNNEYAKKYDTWREKEELHRLEQKYGDKALKSNIEDSSDSEDEDEEPIEMSEETEKQFLKTLSLLKNKDPRIYDPGYKFFDETPDEKKSESKEPKIDTIKPKKEVNSLAAAFADSDSEDDNGEIFKVEKPAPKLQSKEEGFKDYLTGNQDSTLNDVEKDLAPLKALWSDPNLNEGEAFLRDYILNKGYLDEGDANDTHEKLLDDETLEVDEERIEEQGKFERAYNFRFEEPDQEYLKRYPRTMNYIRPKDERRTRKRAEVRTRKEEEKKKKMEEIARLKALKLKEIQEKIAKIKEVTGNQDLAFKEEDIEGDFDPEEHDQRMKAIFDQEYYDDSPDMKKPVFPDLDEELEIENWENYDEELVINQSSNKNEDEGPHCEDEDFNMDADYDPNQSRKNLMEEIKETLGKKRRNRKKKSKLADVLAIEKPKYVPDETQKSYAEYMDEYYKMDCEDVIGGDLPTRFKYREVVPNSFGLTIEEILLADDRDLNKWASLKKTVKFRPDYVEKGEVKTYQQKAHDVELKKKIIPSLFKDIPEEPELVVSAEKNKKKKKKKKKNKDKEQTVQEVENMNRTSNGFEDIHLKTKNSDKNQSGDKLKNNKEEESSLKKNKKRKETDITGVSNNTDNEITGDLEGQVQNLKKKKRKIEQQTVEQPDKSDLESHCHDVNLDNTSESDMLSNNKKNQKHKLPENEGTLKKKKKTVEISLGTGDTIKQKKKKGKINPNAIYKNKKSFKSTNESPLSKLSDERLKAYGLNPKKYRSFLKYKKF